MILKELFSKMLSVTLLVVACSTVAYAHDSESKRLESLEQLETEKIQLLQKIERFRLDSEWKENTIRPYLNDYQQDVVLKDGLATNVDHLLEGAKQLEKAYTAQKEILFQKQQKTLKEIEKAKSEFKTAQHYDFLGEPSWHLRLKKSDISRISKRVKDLRVMIDKNEAKLNTTQPGSQEFKDAGQKMEEGIREMDLIAWLTTYVEDREKGTEMAKEFSQSVSFSVINLDAFQRDQKLRHGVDVDEILPRLEAELVTLDSKILAAKQKEDVAMREAIKRATSFNRKEASNKGLRVSDRVQTSAQNSTSTNNIEPVSSTETRASLGK